MLFLCLARLVLFLDFPSFFKGRLAAAALAFLAVTALLRHSLFEFGDDFFLFFIHFQNLRFIFECNIILPFPRRNNQRLSASSANSEQKGAKTDKKSPCSNEHGLFI